MHPRFLYLEAFHGGSHKAFAEDILRHFPQNFELLSLPDRHWKWRMRGSAVAFASRIPNPEAYDGIVTTNMTSVGELKGLLGPGCPAVLLYMHENQFDYPLKLEEKRDYHLAFTDFVSTASADMVLFNSKSHRSRFLEQCRRFLKRMPDFRCAEALAAIKEKSDVLYPASELLPSGKGPSGSVPLIIWNHRWEHDKNPEAFFAALESVKKRGGQFRLALLGQRYQSAPAVFKEAETAFASEIVTSTYPESRKDYHAWLSRGDILISTAVQENFGISTVEAVAAGCYPLLPDRLSYPELIPEGLHNRHLYNSPEELEEKLLELLVFGIPEKGKAARLAHVAGFSWDALQGEYARWWHRLQEKTRLVRKKRELYGKED